MADRSTRLFLLKEGAYSVDFPWITANTDLLSNALAPLGISSLYIIRCSSEITTKVRRWTHCYWPLTPESADGVRQNPIASVLKRADALRHGNSKTEAGPFV